MKPPIQYRIQIDTKRDGTFAQSIDDVTPYVVGQIMTQAGMADSYENVSQPATLNFTLTNKGGEFDLGYRGTELLVNGDLSSWSGGLPVGWDVGDVFVDGVLLTEVDASETYGGTGTGAANFRSPRPIVNDLVFMSQQVLTPGHTYELNYDITASKIEYVLPNRFTSTGVYPQAGYAIGAVSATPGHYRYIFRAASELFKIGSLIETGLDVTVDNLSIKETSLYGMVGPGMLARLQATYNGTTTTIFIGRITSFKPTWGENTEPQMQVTVQDAMLELLDAEYRAPLLTAPTADTAIARMFDDASVIAWPYAHRFWMLGVVGSSELGNTTTLYSNTLTDSTTLETGQTTFAYLGDFAAGLSGRDDGISAQGYIRDLTNAEFGKFFYDPRDGVFRFYNRQHEPLNDTSLVTQTFTQDDLDSIDPRFGEELNNQFVINYSYRTVGSANSIIWSAPNLPFLLKANTNKVINARYFDATDNTIRIGAKDHITPLAGTDYTANVDSSGGGLDLTTAITVGVEFGATGAKVILSNSGASDAYITLLRLRGTPLTQKDQQTDATDWDSVAAYKLNPRQPQDIRLIDDPDFALNAAQWQVAQFKLPIQRIANMTFNSLRNASMTSAAINRQLGDRITVTVASHNHNADYFIVGERWSISVAGDFPASITYVLKPASRQLFWILGLASQSELGQTTILGF